MATLWELEGNIVGTHWEPGKNGKKIIPSSPHRLISKKDGTFMNWADPPGDFAGIPETSVATILDACKVKKIGDGLWHNK
jgi:hypothetical protein